MFRRKLAAVVAASASTALLAASPAAAVSSVSSGSSCTGRTVIASTDFDNPYKAGVQKMGTLKLVRGTCSGWAGVWGEVNRNGGGAIKVGVKVYHSSGACCSYSLTKSGQSVATPGPAGTVNYTYVIGQALATAGYDRHSVTAYSTTDGIVLATLVGVA